MKKLKTLLCGLFAAAMITGCSDEALNNIDPASPDNGTNNGDGAFMSLDIQMPTANNTSRSHTTTGGQSNDGTEVGQDYENTVTTALVVLAATNIQGSEIPEYGFIAASEIQTNRIADVTESANKKYRAYARLQKTNISQLYQDLPENYTSEPQVYVFVFCNPTKQLSEMFTENGVKYGTTDWINETCTVIQGNPSQPNQNIGIWGTNSFLMNNVSLSTRALPAKETDWENYNSYDKAFHLSDVNENGVDNSSQITGRGSIRVERSVARFDFKDGSELGDNTYNVLYLTGSDGTADDAKPLVTVELEKMALVNMSNKFYYLPRVSDNGQMDGPGYALCGNERGWVKTDNGGYDEGNYVVGPYAKEFGGTYINKNFSTYFNYAFFDDNAAATDNNAALAAGRWDVIKTDDILNNVPDKYQKDPGDYRIWRYVTENVIPGVEQQVNGISTGVVFKAELKGSKDVDESYINNEGSWEKGSSQNLANCLNGEKFTYNGRTTTIQGNATVDPILYYYAGRLYMGWRHIRQAAIQSAITMNAAGEIEINRSNSLYKAVFGEGPIPPTYIIDNNGNSEEKTSVYYYLSNGQEKTIDVKDNLWNKNGENAAWDKSADGLWAAWNGEGKPVVDGNNTPESLAAFRKAVTDGGVTIYQSSVDEKYEAGYYCYYYYWNRHNDNGRNGVMGPMEFAVVRNNVYKLSVDKISRLGHPRVPENDPEPPTPDTPDESDQIYLDVKVEILPWVVRLNSIQF